MIKETFVGPSILSSFLPSFVEQKNWVKQTLWRENVRQAKLSHTHLIIIMIERILVSKNGKNPEYFLLIINPNYLWFLFKNTFVIL